MNLKNYTLIFQLSSPGLCPSIIICFVFTYVIKPHIYYFFVCLNSFLFCLNNFKNLYLYPCIYPFWCSSYLSLELYFYLIPFSFSLKDFFKYSVGLLVMHSFIFSLSSKVFILPLFLKGFTGFRILG